MIIFKFECKTFFEPTCMCSFLWYRKYEAVTKNIFINGRCGLYSNYFSMHHMCLECSTVMCSNYFFLFLLKSYIKDFFDPDKIEFHQLHDIIGNKIFLIFVKRGLCSNYFFFNPIEIWYTILFWVWIFYSFIIYITLLVAKKFLHGNCGLCSNYFF